jgi:hypothetical protein
MKAIHALKNAPITTPARRRTRTSMVRPEAVATRNTSAMARSAPANAARGSAHEVVPARPSASRVTAPTDAPPEIPRI